MVPLTIKSTSKKRRKVKSQKGTENPVNTTKSSLIKTAVIVLGSLLIILGIIIMPSYLAKTNTALSLRNIISGNASLLTGQYKNGSINICGEIPDAAYPTYGNFQKRTGPKWSPNCTYIAWSMWESGTGCPDCPGAGYTELGGEGVFLYNKNNQKVLTVYKGGTSEFQGWVDNDRFIFIDGEEKYIYSVTTQKATAVN